MQLALNISSVRHPTLTPFRISRSSVSAVDVIQLTLSNDEHIGRGECRPYPRYNQTVGSVTAELERVRAFIEKGDIPAALSELENCGAARNALESAWVDYQAKSSKKSAAEILGVAPARPRQTAFTLSWGSPEEMQAAAIRAAAYPWLKIKIGTGGLPQVLAIAEARPDAKLIIDANEALAADSLPEFLQALSDFNIALIEQPLPAEHTDKLPETNLTICADEGLHEREDLSTLWALGYRAVNVKLDKCGGPIAARDLILEARDIGFQIMAGCMVGSSLAMAPMMTLESLCDIVDLDGALLLAEDIEDGIVYDGPIAHPPRPALWG